MPTAPLKVPPLTIKNKSSHVSNVIMQEEKNLFNFLRMFPLFRNLIKSTDLQIKFISQLKRLRKLCARKATRYIFDSLFRRRQNTENESKTSAGWWTSPTSRSWLRWSCRPAGPSWWTRRSASSWCCTSWQAPRTHQHRPGRKENVLKCFVEVSEVISHLNDDEPIGVSVGELFQLGSNHLAWTAPGEWDETF